MACSVLCLCPSLSAGAPAAGKAPAVSNSAAVANAPKPGSELGTGPMVITSATFSTDRQAGTALFEGTVAAKNNDVTLHADKMLVYYAEGGDVTRIDSTGHVSFATKDGTITSDYSVYYADDKRLVFTGEPKAVEGSSVVTGKEIVYYIDKEKYNVKGSKVLFVGKRKETQQQPQAQPQQPPQK